MKRKLRNLLKLQWLGIIGILGDLFHIANLEWFYLFWLLSLVDFFFSVRKISSSISGSFQFLFQNLAMLMSIPIVPLLHGFRLPNKDSFTPQCHYSLPFEGEWLVVNGGVDKETSHSWNMCSQRYAYDFFITDIEGKSYSTNRKELTDYYCYKAPVLAPADGIVMKIVEKYDDTPIGEVGEVDCAAPDVRGNHIIIQHNKHEYSMIAHLLEGSICVKPGDNVKRGEKIALCGNSGNTSEPHIHFQLQSGKSFVFSAGLPISFIDIECDGVITEQPCFITEGSSVRNVQKEKDQSSNQDDRS